MCREHSEAPGKHEAVASVLTGVPVPGIRAGANEQGVQ